jgi:hypothetical protein
VLCRSTEVSPHESAPVAVAQAEEIVMSLGPPVELLLDHGVDMFLGQ